MGFPLEACRKAVYYTGNTGIDSAMNWIMGHMDDSGMWRTKLEEVVGQFEELCKFLCFLRLQTFQLPWCCPAAALDLEARLPRVCPRSIWQPSSPWASAETKLLKPSEQRLETNSRIAIYTSIYKAYIKRRCSHIKSNIYYTFEMAKNKYWWHLKKWFKVNNDNWVLFFF